MRRFGLFLAAGGIGMIVFVLAISDLSLAMGKSVEVPRITKEELQPMLGNPDVVIIDVRIGDEWTKSKEKIQGAIREDPQKVDQWAAKYPQEKTLVFY